MGHDANVNRWYLSDQQTKDRIIVNMMDRLEELENYKTKNEARKGVPSQLIELSNRTKPPNNIA